jgi:hypothetical protein
MATAELVPWEKKNGKAAVLHSPGPLTSDYLRAVELEQQATMEARGAEDLDHVVLDSWGQ